MVTAFTARLLASIDRRPANAVCSPLSTQVALTMAGLGARGATRQQMEQELGGDMEQLARTAAQLREVLAAVGEEARAREPGRGPEPARASLVGGAWAEQGVTVLPEYRALLEEDFGAALGRLDVREAETREAGRREINAWVEERTDQLIQDLIPPGALTAQERLVLVSALHVKAAWPSPLSTAPGTFTTAPGQQREVTMLSGTARGWYEDARCRATALPTAGGEIALALVQPVVGPEDVLDAWAAYAGDAGEHTPGESGMPGDGLDAVLEGVDRSPERVDLTLPALDISFEEELSTPLRQLGMTAPFGPGADFTGITEGAHWFISQVLHKAVLTVDEHGMEAAAATALMTRLAAAAPPQRRLVLDAPFLVIAYETTTRTPLVAGWIGDPSRTR